MGYPEPTGSGPIRTRRVRGVKMRHGFLIAGLVFACGAPPAAADPGTTLVYPPWSHCYGLHRVNQSHLTLRAGFKYKFIDPQGMAALKLAAEDDPSTTRDDDELTVFGVNSGQHLLIFNTSITSIAFYGKEGDGVGEFRRPHGIAADRDGRVFVADTGNDRLHVLQYANDRLHHVRFIAGVFDGMPLRGPTGVALEEGEVYVCDPENRRVLVFDLEGTWRRTLRPMRDGRPLLENPFAVAVIRDQDLNFFGEDFVVVTDSSWQRLWKLDRLGTPFAVRRVSEVAHDGGEFYYTAIDYHANIYCTDRRGRVHKFDRNLRYLLSIGKSGTGDLEFDAPRGIGLYRRFGQMFVAERQGAQYLWIGTDVFTPSIVDVQSVGGGMWTGTARFFLTEYASVSLDLVDVAGRVVAPVQSAAWTIPGAVERRLQWRRAESLTGLRLRVRAVPTYSARKVLAVEKFSQPLDRGGR